MKTMTVEKRKTHADIIGEEWTQHYNEGDQLDSFIGDTKAGFIFDETILLALIKFTPGRYTVLDGDFNYYIEITEAIVG